MDRFRNTRQPDWDWWGRLWPAPGETLRELGLESGDTLAEVGSGNGYFALPAARIAAPGSVYALDIDASLLSELSHLADQQDIANVTTVEGDVRELSERLPEPVDVALVANTLHGVDDRAALVDQVFESLGPDGRFVVVNWRPLPKERTRIDDRPRGPPTELRMAPEETRRVVLDAGPFAHEATVDLPPYHYGQVFEASARRR